MKGECGKIELKVGDYFERFSQNCVYFCGWVIYGSVCISDDAWDGTSDRHTYITSKKMAFILTLKSAYDNIKIESNAKGE